MITLFTVLSGAFAQGSGDGLRGQYYQSTDYNGIQNYHDGTPELLMTRVDPQVDFNWGTGPGGAPAPLQGDPYRFGVKWSGQVEAVYTETYTFTVQTQPWTYSQLYVNGQLLFNFNATLSGTGSGTVAMTAGQRYDIRLEYQDGGGSSGIRLLWSSPSQTQQVIPQSYLYAGTLPNTPSAPVYSNIQDASLDVQPAAWPANTNRLILQGKRANDDDYMFADIAAVTSVGTVTHVTEIGGHDLQAGQKYIFRYVADGSGGFSQGIPGVLWTRPADPDEPGPPIFQSVTQSSVIVAAPPLPPNALSVTLQKSVGDESNYTDVEGAINVAAGTATELTDLISGTTYWFRYRAEGRVVSVTGQGDSVVPTIPPDTPPAPKIASVTHNAISVQAPVLPPITGGDNNWPQGANYIELQIKLQAEPDAAYRSGYHWDVSEQGETDYLQWPDHPYLLEPNADYSLRLLARNGYLSNDGVTPGPAINVRTLHDSNGPPEVPGTPQFSNITQTGASVVLPSLPVGATSLTLQQQQPDNSFVDVPSITEQSGGTQHVLSGLTLDTDYIYRVKAIGIITNQVSYGPAAGFSTDAPAPAAPGAPANIIDLSLSSLEITAPSLPQYARTLSLEAKEDGPYFTYQTIAIGIEGGATTTIGSLFQGKTYWFRYVAVGVGGETAAATADEISHAMGVLATSWQAGTPIQCEGIRWPTANTTVQAGHEQALSSYLATDWDQRELSISGQSVTSWRSDTCIYYWNTPDGGSFKHGINSAQSVTWIAPSTPGDYTIELVVVDQDQANRGTNETGSRDDSSRGWWDDPLKFRVTLTVVP